MRMYEPQAADLLMKLGLSVEQGGGASPEGGAPAADKVVPVEGVQALSAAMSLIGGDAGVSADVRWCLRMLFFMCGSKNECCFALPPGFLEGACLPSPWGICTCRARAQPGYDAVLRMYDFAAFWWVRGRVG